MKGLLHFTGYIIVRLGGGLLAYLPQKLLLGISRLIAWLLQYVIGYRKAVIYKNISNSFPHLSPTNQNKIVSEYYVHLSDLLLETLRAFRLPKKQLQSEFSYTNTNLLHTVLEKKQSIILLGSHYGNWEIGCLSFPLQVNCPVYTVYKPLSNPYLDRYLKQLREKWGMQMIPMKQLGRILVANKNKQAIYILVADQSPATTVHAIWKPFLHQSTPFINGIEKVARSTNYPVFYFAIDKLTRGKYSVTFSNIWNGLLLENEQPIVDRYIEKLTLQIAQEPSHWLWSHNRWKRAGEEIEA